MKTTLKARLVLLGFVVLAAGISVNALILQYPRKPDGQEIRVNPAVAPASNRQPEGRQRLEPPAAAAQQQQAKPPAARPANATPAEAQALDTVTGIQRELKRRGYHAGPEDGQAHVGLREAIIAYEFDRGLPLTGEPTQQLLKELLFAPFSSAPPQQLSPKRLESTVELVKQVQTALASLGYGPQAINGKLDEPTRAAIRLFQTERNIPATGALSERLLLEIYTFTGQPLGGNT
jgi:peptidoglycan hydrolase-like protein with peptidoglycan-binding domain